MADFCVVLRANGLLKIGPKTSSVGLSIVGLMATSSSKCSVRAGRGGLLTDRPSNELETRKLSTHTPVTQESKTRTGNEEKELTDEEALEPATATASAQSGASGSVEHTGSR